MFPVPKIEKILIFSIFGSALRITLYFKKNTNHFFLYKNFETKENFSESNKFCPGPTFFQNLSQPQICKIWGGNKISGLASAKN
jgi:hypothetical protein